MVIRHLKPADWQEWLRMRQTLWDDTPVQKHETEMQDILNNVDAPVFVAERPDGRLGGFLEGGMRKHADGCETGPVGYIEGWYVDADLRRKGVGGALVQAMEAWARERGLTAMASDTCIENETSMAAHRRLGYEEAERLAHFVKRLS